MFLSAAVLLDCVSLALWIRTKYTIRAALNRTILFQRSDITFVEVSVFLKALISSQRSNLQFLKQFVDCVGVPDSD